MFERPYNYAEAIDKCAEDGGNLALAADTDTFDLLSTMYSVYRMQGGRIGGAFVDGVMITKEKAFCRNTRGECPATMPWQTGYPSDAASQQCLSIQWQHDNGVANTYCDTKKLAVCQYTSQITNVH